jgi:hypothetical protein
MFSVARNLFRQARRASSRLRPPGNGLPIPYRIRSAKGLSGRVACDHSDLNRLTNRDASACSAKPTLQETRKRSLSPQEPLKTEIIKYLAFLRGNSPTLGEALTP